MRISGISRWNNKWRGRPAIPTNISFSARNQLNRHFFLSIPSQGQYGRWGWGRRRKPRSHLSLSQACIEYDEVALRGSLFHEWALRGAVTYIPLMLGLTLGGVGRMRRSPRLCHPSNSSTQPIGIHLISGENPCPGIAII